MIRKIYNIPIFKKHLSKLLFVLKNRPSIDPKYINSNRGYGYFVMSADFELAWAFRYAKNFDYNFKAKIARNNFNKILVILNNNKIPITWATVGHLFLEKCDIDSHKEMKRIPYFENRNWKYKSGDWFDHDPRTNYIDAPYWYAPDLIRKIIASPVKHEIGCHTFSHIDFSDLNCPKEVANDEIKACVKEAVKWGIQLKSFVAPGGTRGNFEVLKEYNFTNYRKTIAYELSMPEIDNNGLVMIPASVGLDDNGLGWSIDYQIKRLKKYIDKSIEFGLLCHFWFHPSLNPFFLENVFKTIIEYVKYKSDKGELKIMTMGEIANRTINNNL